MALMTANAGGNSANPGIHFGHQVRKQRRSHGWTIYQLSDRSGISVGYLSQIENGKRPPNERTAGKIDAVFPEREGWFSEFYEDSQVWAPPGYRRWHEYEDRASQIWAWSPGVLHGLVQTEKYAEAHLKTVPGVPDEIVAARLKARMERQQGILHRDPPPAVWILVDELSLYRLAGSPEIMTGQMDALLNVAKLDHVTLQVVPAVVHAITSAELIVTDTASYTEHLGGGAVYVEPDTVTAHQRRICSIQANAYRADESAEIVRRVRGLWTSGNPATALLTAGRALRSARLAG